MKKIISYWLEIIFIIFDFIVIILSIKNSVHDIEIVNEKTMPQSEKKIGDYDFVNYIEKVRQLNNCTVIIAIKDIQGQFINQEMTNVLKSLGFIQADALLDESYHSFIGVYANGDEIYHCIGGDEAITFSQMIGNQYVYIKSATWSTGNIAEIYVDDVSYALNRRGFNIVVFDNQENELIDSVSYDTHVEDILMYRRENKEIVCVEEVVKE